MLTVLAGVATVAFPEGINDDEDRVPPFTLPDPLVARDGSRIRDPGAWEYRRRPEILRLFAENVYGMTPEIMPEISTEMLETDDNALGGAARRKQIRLHFRRAGRHAHMDLLLYLPNRNRPAPVFVGLNFFGNHSIQADPAIVLSDAWFRDNEAFGVSGNRASERSRGARAERWPVEHIIARGYGLATAYYGDLDPDYDDGFTNGIHPLFYRDGQTRPEPNQWGAIGAWAWGLSRAMDYMATDADIDAARVAVMGHSRLGKTSLWAGAQDRRFAMVVSNDSGCGGAALSRRWYGETVERINTSFPHWFCDNFKTFNRAVHDLPVDQHMLIALAAPRPVYVASAAEDRWADPRGEFLAALNATPAYELLNAGTLAITDMPAVGHAVLSQISYHVRPGKHGVTVFDWDRYMDLADLTLG